MYEEEVERLVGEYNQSGKHGRIYSMDGKAMLGKRKGEETGNEYLLSVYDGAQAKVLSQVNGRTIKTSNQVEFGITSLTRQESTPLTLLNIRRAHWGIFTSLHYRRDVTLKEDATCMTVGHAAVIMASLNNLVLALIRQAKFQNAAQARRWFSAHILKAFSLLTTPSTPL